MLKAKALFVLPVALLVAIAAIRAMTFLSPADHPLRRLQPLFPGHPAAQMESAMRQIGASAAKGGGVPVSAHQAMLSAARTAPLAPDPFLVEGTIVQMRGDPR